MCVCVCGSRTDGDRAQKEDGSKKYEKEVKLSPALIHCASCIVSLPPPTEPSILSSISTYSNGAVKCGKTAACMAIHYPVKLPMASLEPHGRERERAQFMQWSLPKLPRLSQRRERLEKTFDTQEAAEPDKSVITVVIHILVLLLVWEGLGSFFND